MDQPEVVVRKPPQADGQVRTGILLARHGSVMRVRWDDDGHEEDVPINVSTTFVRRGTVRHQGLVDPAALIARLESDPVTVVVQLLRETRSPLTAVKIKEKFEDLGLSAETIAKAWRRAQAKLGTAERVKVSGRSSHRSYKWIEYDPDSPRPEPVPEPVPEPEHDPIVQDLPSTVDDPLERQVPAVLEAVGAMAPVPDTGDLAADLHAGLTALIRMLDGPRGSILARLAADAQTDPDLAGDLRERLVRPGVAQFKERMRRAQRQGRLAADADLDVALDLLYGPVYRRFTLHLGMPAPEYLDALITHALRALNPPPAG